MNSKLIVLVGLQASGKSTVAKELAKKDGRAKVLSSDVIREQYPTWDNNMVFKQLYSQINYELSCGYTVIMDATNISIKSRKHVFEQVKESCYKVCYIVNTPIEVCRLRLIERNKSNYPNKVPMIVLEKYWKSFQVPFKEEGWDEIILHNNFIRCPVNNIDTFQMMTKFSQNNKHHTQTLGEHSKTVLDNLYEALDLVDLEFQWGCKVSPALSNEEINLMNGTHLHDVGKLWTQVYKEGDTNAHYYCHAEVGSYWKICNGWTVEEVFYECYHMALKQELKDKTKEKYKNLFGEEKYNNLILLNECDKAS